MPIYEYICQSCGQHKEVLQKISDAPLTDCEACGQKRALKKMVSSASFRLKGGGWYETDFKGGSKSKAADSSKTSTETSPAKSTESSSSSGTKSGE